MCNGLPTRPYVMVHVSCSWFEGEGLLVPQSCDGMVWSILHHLVSFRQDSFPACCILLFVHRIPLEQARARIWLCVPRCSVALADSSTFGTIGSRNDCREMWEILILFDAVGVEGNQRTNRFDCDAGARFEHAYGHS